MIIVENDEQFYVNTSTIPGAGDGLFAKTFLAEGVRLEVLGVLVPAGSVSDVCTRYADCYKFRVGDLLLIPLGFGGMVNHSRNPNLKKAIDGQRVYLRTTRPIHPGEELFFTYGEEFFKVAKIDPDSF
jgi:SET domain